MTTIVGITARKGRQGIVLASDLSGTRVSWAQQNSDVAVRQQTRVESQKIYISNDMMFAFAGAGIVDEAYKQFIFCLKENKIDLKKALGEGHFKDFFDLHIGRFGGYIWQQENANGLLIASRYDLKSGGIEEKPEIDLTPKLFTCFQLGKAEERFYTSIGSGSRHALEYLQDRELTVPEELDLQSAVRLASSSLEAATKDIYTGGLDIAVVTSDGIKSYSELINRRLVSARHESIDSIVGDCS